ncbi:hypothetical protein [Haladaptatus caseinilyticus]|uniref:hypothetical protein n=1 Tax=Haladaptatus caseinilyticus TaxID=2993314 RepID=UPI00224B878C|nr:hypothetical protein [Haladaptatus caseinilyticus]
MTDPTDDMSAEQTAETLLDESIDGELPEITCTLTPDQTDQRMEWVEGSLLPHLESIQETEDGFTFVFDRRPEAYAAVASASWKESQCCAWATFDVELPMSDDSIKWHVRSDRTDGLEFFREALQETLQQFENAPSLGQP